MTTEANPDAAAAAAAAATAAAAAAAGAKPAWHGVPETDAAGLDYIKNKGWTGPQDVIKSYQGAEKFIGKDPSTLLQLPRADDPAGLLSVLDKLGRPATADKYDFGKPPEGLTVDEKFQTFARSTFHEIGLLPGQAKTLNEKYNAFIVDQMKASDAEYTASVAADKKALETEWRNGTERQMNIAKGAAKTLGFTPEMIDGIERTVGYGGTWKFFAALGAKMGEPGFVTGDGKPKFDGQMTPAEASAEWDRVKNDPIAMKALSDKTHPDNAKWQKKQTDLFAIMYPAK
jgi:hypothetical protein